MASSMVPSAAEIRTLTISSDNRPMILFEKFGFTHIGHVLVEIQQNPQLCVLDSRYITHLFNFKELSPPPQASFNHSYPVSAPNEYSLFFANCVPETTVSMIVWTEVYNLDPDGSRDYLSAGLTNLPSLFSVFFLAYLVFVGFWVYLCYTNKRSVHRIHLLMGGLLLMKALNLICTTEDKHCVKGKKKFMKQMTHGSKSHRALGSIGAGTTPGRVYKGKKMPGRMGGTKTKIRKLKIVKIDKELNVVMIKGALPGLPNQEEIFSISPYSDDEEKQPSIIKE
ncbi:hypothetical protein ACFX13_034879 [Malus domestica]|uniref:Large ribosomal subunit protein uL3c n=1 Tax=Malus domestica TaxID=3750 RepID=A0A498K4D4_MALDO|nr:hypothetical protein DVH24_037720 [Malus domestica]